MHFNAPTERFIALDKTGSIFSLRLTNVEKMSPFRSIYNYPLFEEDQDYFLKRIQFLVVFLLLQSKHFLAHTILLLKKPVLPNPKL